MYNARLDQMATADGSVKVWCVDPDYENAITAENGEDKYREVGRYPPSIYGKGKVRRARMAATDAELLPPSQLLQAIKWLGAVKPKEPRESRPRSQEDLDWEAAAPGWDEASLGNL